MDDIRDEGDQRRKALTSTVGRGSNWQMDGFGVQMRSEKSEAVGSWITESG